MRLPKDLLSGNYKKPDVILCQTNKDKIGKLNVTDLKGTFKWNSYSEISFTISRTYCDINTGEIKVNPYYDMVQGLRLVYLEGFGYFQLQDPQVEFDGIKEIKSINAYSTEYDLAQRYLTNFIINKGTEGSLDDVKFYASADKNYSLLDLILREKVPDWTIGHVDASLAGKKYSFEQDRIAVYNFFMNDICDKLACVAIFDTIDNTINFYEEDNAGRDTNVDITLENLAKTIKVNYNADDIKTMLTVTGADDIDVRSVNFGLPHIIDLSYYHTIDWMGEELYYAYNDYLEVLEANREDHDRVEKKIEEYTNQLSDLNNRAGESLSRSKLSNFYNFVAELKKNSFKVSEKLTTQLDNLTEEFKNADIKESESYKKLVEEQQRVKDLGLGEYYIGNVFIQSKFGNVDMDNRISIMWTEGIKTSYEDELISWGYEPTTNTISTILCYSDRFGEDVLENGIEIAFTPILNANKKATLLSRSVVYDYINSLIPDSIINGEFDFNKMLSLDEQGKQIGDITIKNIIAAADKSLNYENNGNWAEVVSRLIYFVGEYGTIGLLTALVRKEAESVNMTLDNFICQYRINEYWDQFVADMKSASSENTKMASIHKMLDIIWLSYGLNMLKTYQDSYKGVQSSQIEQGMSTPSSSSYHLYYANVAMLQSVERRIPEVEALISKTESGLQREQAKMDGISNIISMDTNFTQRQQARLAPFLREDEYSNDCFVVTEMDSLQEELNTKRALLAYAHKELKKVSQPQLSFSMTMANILALHEFEPIHDQFELGNFIIIELRPGYVKKARLFQVEIDFDDLSNFTADFGDLMSLRDQSNIHVDLLSKAVTAGKKVSINSAHWEKTSSDVSYIEKQIEKGLLDEATSIKAIDGTQGVEIDKYGIHLRKIKDNGSYDDKQGWIVDNKILYTDDNWSTAKSVFGEFSYDSNGDGIKETHWGLMAGSVVSGFIQGATIEGGTIDIGNGTFKVNSDGTVDINSFGGKLLETTTNNAYSSKIVAYGPLFFTDVNQSTTLTCTVYNGGANVTSSLPSGTTYKWVRYSDNSEADATWNSQESHTTSENYITLTYKDVEFSAQFSCEVNIPNSTKEVE